MATYKGSYNFQELPGRKLRQSPGGLDILTTSFRGATADADAFFAAFSPGALVPITGGQFSTFRVTEREMGDNTGPYTSVSITATGIFLGVPPEPNYHWSKNMLTLQRCRFGGVLYSTLYYLSPTLVKSYVLPYTAGVDQPPPPSPSSTPTGPAEVEVIVQGSAPVKGVVVRDGANVSYWVCVAYEYEQSGAWWVIRETYQVLVTPEPSTDG